MPVSASRQWRQNWGHLGPQGYGEQEMMYSVSMTSSMESSRDAFSMRHSEASQQVCCIAHSPARYGLATSEDLAATILQAADQCLLQW